jgi:hypothetical protein
MKQLRRDNAVTPTSPSHEASIQPPGAPPIMSTHETEQDGNQPVGEGARDKVAADSRHATIREAAYRLYEKRGYIDGYAQDDWLEAEAELGPLLEDRKTSAD